MASEDKIMQVMDFYVNKMGFETSFIVNRPILIIIAWRSGLFQGLRLLKFCNQKV